MSKFPLLSLLLLLISCSTTDPPPLPAGNPTTGILFTSTRHDNEEIYHIQADGTGLTRLTHNDTVDQSPAWSPDGTRIAYRSRLDGSSDIFLMAPDGSGILNLLNDPAGSFDDEFIPKWHPHGQQLALYTDRPPLQGCTGHMPAIMTLTGGTDSLIKSGTSGESFTWTPDGQNLLISTPCFGTGHQFRLWNIKTDQLRPFTPTAHFESVSHPAYAHNGQYLAFQAIQNGNGDIYLLNIATGQITNLTNHPNKDTQPTWSPDDSHIAFVTNRDGNDEIYIMQADGSAPQNLTNHPGRDTQPDWSPIQP